MLETVGISYACMSLTPCSRFCNRFTLRAYHILYIVVTYYNTFPFKYAYNLDYFLIEREIMYLFNIDYINDIQYRLFQAIILKLLPILL